MSCGAHTRRAAHAAVLSRLLQRLGSQAVAAVLDEVISLGHLLLTPAGYLRVKRSAHQPPAKPGAELALLLEMRLYERGLLDAEAALLVALDEPPPQAPRPTGRQDEIARRGYAKHPQYCARCDKALTWAEYRGQARICEACAAG